MKKVVSLLLFFLILGVTMAHAIPFKSHEAMGMMGATTDYAHSVDIAAERLTFLKNGLDHKWLKPEPEIDLFNLEIAPNYVNHEYVVVLNNLSKKTPAPVPEPATMLLLGLGLFGLGTLKRKKKI